MSLFGLRSHRPDRSGSTLGSHSIVQRCLKVIADNDIKLRATSYRIGMSLKVSESQSY